MVLLVWIRYYGSGYWCWPHCLVNNLQREPVVKCIDATRHLEISLDEFLVEVAHKHGRVSDPRNGKEAVQVFREHHLLTDRVAIVSA